MFRESAYIELHARSAFSFLRGASQPETLVERAAELGMLAIAVTDRDGFYGSARVHYAGREHGPRGIVGTELTMEDGTGLPLLVAQRPGYQQLCKLITTAKLRCPKNTPAADPRSGGAPPPNTAAAATPPTPASASPKPTYGITWKELEQAVEEAGRGALVALTGDVEGPVLAALSCGDHELASQRTQTLIELFGRDNVRVELQRHKLRGERYTIRRLRELAEHHRLPLLATGGTDFATKDRRPLADAFTCLRHHTVLDEAGKLLAQNPERYLKDAPTMAERFADLPEALAESRRLAERLEFTLENLGYEFPAYPCRDDETMPEVLRRETYHGARYRYGTITKRIREQLDHELALIEKLGFCGYFLVVWDIVNAARDLGVFVQGRGSAANSAVCYSLGITACDPIGFRLLFERFLSEGRSSWPDIDLDLPSGDRRESVIQHVFEKYAPRGAAMTANVITYRGRSAMREMGKVLGIPEDTLGRFSDLYASGDFPHTIDLEEQIAKAGLPAEHPRLPALVHLLQAVHRMPRHLGQHSGGMVISDKGLDTVVPLENASMEGRRVVQWDKDDCEDLGIIKVDLLGLGMMAAIQDTIELCSERGRGREFDIAKLPDDDEKTFELMQKADTIGVFQIESRAQMATLPRMKPKVFYDVVVEVAIIRPGPIVGDLVHPYLNRRDGKEPVDYIDPRFEPVLDRTLGVPLFQEQVLKMAMVIADFSGSEADELRRAMSFHRSEVRMQKATDKLRSRMSERGVERQVQDKIIKSICSFALYGFPESHAISFGLLAYASTWMKAHRAVEFYAALLNNQPMGFYSPATLLKDAKRHGIRARPVCAVESEVLCTVEDDSTLRLGLCMVKGLHRDNAELIVTERARQPFRSLDDFLLRIPLSKKDRRTLAKVGALNTLLPEGHRRSALWEVEKFMDMGDLFSQPRTPNSELRTSPPPLKAMGAAERLAADYSGLGLTTGPHPMAYIRDTLDGVWPAMSLPQGRHGQTVTTAGLVICRQRPGTAKGHLFISLEDETGISNAFVPSPTFEKYRLVITTEQFLKITGRIQRAHNVVTLYTTHVEALPFDTSLITQSHDFH